MWYVKDEYTNKIYFKHEDVRITQSFVNRYNSNKKFCGQRMFKFNLYDFSGIILFWESKIDVNNFTKRRIFESKYKHPLAVKNFDKKHRKYLEEKFKKVKTLCKKHHVWSYNEKGRKCDEFDF